MKNKMSKAEIARLDARMAELDKYLKDPNLVLTRGPSGKLQFQSKSDMSRAAARAERASRNAEMAKTFPLPEEPMPPAEPMAPSGTYRPSWGGSMAPVPSTNTAAPRGRSRPGGQEKLSNYAGDMATGFGQGMLSGLSFLATKGKGRKPSAPKTSGGAMAESGPRAIFRGRSYRQEEPARLSGPSALPRLGSSRTQRLEAPATAPRLSAPKPAKPKEKKVSSYSPRADVIGKRKPKPSATLSRPVSRQGRDVSSMSTGAAQDTIRNTTRTPRYKPGKSKRAKQVRGAVEAFRNRNVSLEEAADMAMGYRHGGRVHRRRK